MLFTREAIVGHELGKLGSGFVPGETSLCRKRFRSTFTLNMGRPSLSLSTTVLALADRATFPRHEKEVTVWMCNKLAAECEEQRIHLPV